MRKYLEHLQSWYGCYCILLLVMVITILLGMTILLLNNPTTQNNSRYQIAANSSNTCWIIDTETSQPRNKQQPTQAETASAGINRRTVQQLQETIMNTKQHILIYVGITLITFMAIVTDSTLFWLVAAVALIGESVWLCQDDRPLTQLKITLLALSIFVFVILFLCSGKIRKEMSIGSTSIRKRISFQQVTANPQFPT